MNSLRMCIACRNMKDKAELIRIVKSKGGFPEIDLSFKAQGRGAYICKSCDCLLKARKIRAIERALKGEATGIYEALGDMINEG